MRFAVLIMFCFSISLSGSAWAAVAVGSPALSIESTKSYNTADGSAMNVHAMAGRVVLIDFWATWCGPCVASIPHIQKLHDTYAAKGLIVIGHTDGSSNGLESFIAKHNITYPISVGANIGDNYGVTGIPALVVIDAEGKVAWQGHPNRLEESLIAELLTKVDMSNGPGLKHPSFAEASKNSDVRQIEQAIEAGHVNKGWTALERLVKAAKRKPDEAAAAAVSIEYLIEWTDEQLSAIEEKEEEGDVFGAATLAEAVAKLIGRRDQTKTFSDKAKALKKHDQYRNGKAFSKFLQVPAYQHEDPRFQKELERFLKKCQSGYYADEARKLLK